MSMAYLDNVFLQDQFDAVSNASVDLRSAFAPIRLEIRDSKCHIDCPLPKESKPLLIGSNIPVFNKGTIVLRIPISRENFM